MPCPFCGMTTAFALMAEGRVSEAFASHVLGPPGYLVAWLVLVAGLVGLVRGRPPLPRWLFAQVAGRVIMAIVLAGWAVNLVRAVW